tara:strand:- start:27 stop:191 length:165 start_codon:yes stop_codon:yes gene_type:complete
MTIRAYYLLADPEDYDDSDNLSEMALDLELSNHMDVVDYMLVDDEIFNSPYIAY